MEKEEKTIENKTIGKPDFINTDYEEYLKWKEKQNETNKSTD